MFVSGGHSIHHAVAQMVLQNHLTGVVQRGADSCQLYQHFGTIISLFHHALDLFQMTHCPCQTVDHRLLIFVDMAMGMGDAVGVHIGVIMIVIMVVMMVAMVMVVVMTRIVMMVCHIRHLLTFFPSILHFFQNCKPPRGIGKRNVLTRGGFLYIMKEKCKGAMTMHLHHDHLGHGAHAHEHNHTHTHEHTHDGVTHSHAHEHAHEHDHQHPHEHDHLHGEGHTHDHSHCEGHCHEHGHDHGHCHEHGHDHGHECGGHCGGCGHHEHTPMEELVALMKYMANHNAAHANELAALAQQLKQAGNPVAYEQVMAAVSDYEKGNMRLAAILASLEVK